MSTTNETPTVALVRCRISPRNCALFCFRLEIDDV